MRSGPSPGPLFTTPASSMSGAGITSADDALRTRANSSAGRTTLAEGVDAAGAGAVKVGSARDRQTEIGGHSLVPRDVLRGVIRVKRLDGRESGRGQLGNQPVEAQLAGMREGGQAAGPVQDADHFRR